MFYFNYKKSVNIIKESQVIKQPVIETSTTTTESVKVTNDFKKLNVEYSTVRQKKPVKNQDNFWFNNNLFMTKHNLSINVNEKREYPTDFPYLLPNDSKSKNSEKIMNVGNSSNIFFITNIKSGGSYKYMDDFINHYTNNNIVTISDKSNLINNSYSPNDIIMVQQLLFTDIKPNDIINLKYKFGCKIIICIHDFCWFASNSNEINEQPSKIYQNGYLKSISKIHHSIKKLFNIASLVIHPSKFTFENYSRYFCSNNFILQKHNDINIDYSTKRVPLIINNTINIGNIQEFMEYKGSENIELLMEKYKFYKGYNINFLCVGVNTPKYDESNWYSYIIEHNFHCLLHLNKFGETYSYCLTKSINSGLPILYNNIGALKERIPDNRLHYIKVTDSEIEYFNSNLLFTQFEKMLNYIIENNGLFSHSNPSNVIKYNSLSDFIFNKNNICSSKQIYEKIKPFAVYFPQFHKIPENDLNYYNQMTDITNLIYYTNKYKPVDEILDTPSLSELNLSKLIDYNLSNKKIINKHIDIAKNNNIYGFAIYYYWFSTNTVTNKNTIMEKCYNLFFGEKINDFKVFFIWANEDWSNNPAFNSTKQISNEYNIVNFRKNINNLMNYFKHPNYYKINNKPVLYIHHPFCMSESNLELFKDVLDRQCLLNGFDGSLLVLNNIEKTYENHNNYNFHPNYKKNNTTDYDTYVKNFVNNVDNITDCIFFDFNNSARLSYPNKLNLVTKFKNVTSLNQDNYIKKVFNKYKKKNRDELNKILLVNAWNEWGENMVIEPGNLNSYKYLNLIKSNLLTFL
jgi:hypothetical protein